MRSAIPGNRALSRRALLTGMGACLVAGTHATAQPARALSVVATTGMIADTARAVGGAMVHIRALMGPGVDPHGYRQTTTDIAAMSQAEIVLWNGLYLEAQMERFLGELGKRRRVVAVGEAVPVDLRLRNPAYEERYDPHVWIDPGLWTFAVDAIRDAFAAAREPLREAFAANAAAHRAAIAETAVYARSVLHTVPPDQRVLVTAHDAFGYFGRTHGYEVVGIQGISTESEAGLSRIREIVDRVVERRISAIFVETSVADRNIRAVIEGAQSRGHTVRIGGELFSDAMGPAGTYEGTYIGMVDHNATMVASALGGKAPVGGMQGKLAAAR